MHEIGSCEYIPCPLYVFLHFWHCVVRDTFSTFRLWRFVDVPMAQVMRLFEARGYVTVFFFVFAADHAWHDQASEENPCPTSTSNSSFDLTLISHYLLNSSTAKLGQIDSLQN